MSTMSITFLGTSSGGGPTAMRNCSSLVADVQGNGKLWMVDCAEGTLRQFALQPIEDDWQRLKVTSVEKIFITHMHADHIMGIISLLRNLLYPVPNPALGPRPTKEEPTVEIYGPAGIRNFVRQNMKMTFSHSTDKYAVHELLTPSDTPTSCTDSERHVSEASGEDFVADGRGFWSSFVSLPSLLVDAGPIHHRDPCLAYVFRRTDLTPQKSIAILGDTCDPSALFPLLMPPPDLVIHEATDAYIPTSLDPRATRSPEAVEQAALFRGHSTPEQAGSFAKQVCAKRLVLNHIGSRFPLPGPGMGRRLKEMRSDVIREIERQASETWGMGVAAAAYDFMRVEIPLLDNNDEPKQRNLRSDAFPTVANTSHSPNGDSSSPRYHNDSQNQNYSCSPQSYTSPSRCSRGQGQHMSKKIFIRRRM